MVIPPGLQVTKFSHLLLVENSDNSGFQQFNKIFNSLWKLTLYGTAYLQLTKIQQFNSLGNTLIILSKLLILSMSTEIW